jgi:hypothetical protein
LQAKNERDEEKELGPDMFLKVLPGDYICGQIDRQQFEGVVAAHGLGVLKRDLNNGGLVTSIKLLRYDDLDDDQIELCWKESDETVSRFKPREG